MGTDYYVKGRKSGADAVKKKARSVIKNLESLGIAPPTKLYELLDEGSDIPINCTSGPGDDYYEYVVKLAELPDDVTEVVFQISR